MPKKLIYHYTPAAGLRTDFKRLMNDFISAKTVRFETFSELWRNRNFGFLYAGRFSERETREFVERAFLNAIEFFLPPYQFQVRVGGLYLLYGIFMTQPIAPKVKVRLTMDQWKETVQFLQEANHQTHLDVVYVFNRMLEDCAFQFAYTSSEMNDKRSNMERDDDEVNLADDMKEERREITRLFDYESMEQLSYLLDHYHQMKTNLAGPKASKPDKSLDVVQGSMVENLISLLQNFKDNVSNIYKHGSVNPLDNDNGEGRSEMSIYSKRQAIKARLYDEVNPNPGMSTAVEKPIMSSPLKGNDDKLKKSPKAGPSDDAKPDSLETFTSPISSSRLKVTATNNCNNRNEKSPQKPGSKKQPKKRGRKKKLNHESKEVEIKTVGFEVQCDLDLSGSDDHETEELSPSKSKETNISSTSTKSPSKSKGKKRKIESSDMPFLDLTGSDKEDEQSLKTKSKRIKKPKSEIKQKQTKKHKSTPVKARNGIENSNICNSDKDIAKDINVKENNLSLRNKKLKSVKKKSIQLMNDTPIVENTDKNSKTSKSSSDECTSQLEASFDVNESDCSFVEKTNSPKKTNESKISSNSEDSIKRSKHQSQKMTNGEKKTNNRGEKVLDNSENKEESRGQSKNLNIEVRANLFNVDSETDLTNRPISPLKHVKRGRGRPKKIIENKKPIENLVCIDKDSEGMMKSPTSNFPTTTGVVNKTSCRPKIIKGVGFASKVKSHSKSEENTPKIAGDHNVESQSSPVKQIEDQNKSQDETNTIAVVTKKRRRPRKVTSIESDSDEKKSKLGQHSSRMKSDTRTNIGKELDQNFQIKKVADRKKMSLKDIYKTEHESIGELNKLEEASDSGKATTFSSWIPMDHRIYIGTNPSSPQKVLNVKRFKNNHGKSKQKSASEMVSKGQSRKRLSVENNSNEEKLEDSSSAKQSKLENSKSMSTPSPLKLTYKETDIPNVVMVGLPSSSTSENKPVGQVNSDLIVKKPPKIIKIVTKGKSEAAEVLKSLQQQQDSGKNVLSFSDLPVGSCKVVSMESKSMTYKNKNQETEQKQASNTNKKRQTSARDTSTSMQETSNCTKEASTITKNTSNSTKKTSTNMRDTSSNTKVTSTKKKVCKQKLEYIHEYSSM